MRSSATPVSSPPLLPRSLRCSPNTPAIRGVVAVADQIRTRPAVRELTQLLKFRSSFGRPCYVKRNKNMIALIVPHLRDGADEPYAFLRCFTRATLHDAIDHGHVVLGDELADVPAFEGPVMHWAAEPAHQGRTISLTEVAR